MGVPAQSLVPVLVSGGLSFVQISAGWTHVSMRELVGVAGVMRGVVLLCTIRRALGQNCMIPSLMPFAPPPTHTHAHPPTCSQTCGIIVDGSVYCFGDGANGQLGLGTTSASTSPARVPGSLVFLDISAGNLFTCGLLQNSSAMCW